MQKTVKRFDLELTGYDGAMMSEGDKGDYVQYTDYAELEKKIEAIQGNNSFLMKQNDRLSKSYNFDQSNLSDLKAKLEKAVEALKNYDTLITRFYISNWKDEEVMRQLIYEADKPLAELTKGDA